jgi:2,6-dihydroxypseudooxynicotine hydrolase
VNVVPDERVQVAINNWGPRMISNGIDYNDFVRTTSSLERWDQWLDAWTATAEVHRSLAVAARDAGHQESAGEAFLRAAVTYHFSKFVWVMDVERNRRATEAAVQAMYDGLAIVDTSAERLEVPLDGGVIAGNLRRPSERSVCGSEGSVRGSERSVRASARSVRASARSVPPPLVILLPGLDSTKEEFHRWESVFLRRGMATLSLDGPGQGETGFRMPIRHDYEVAVAAVLDAVAGRDDLDLDRVGAAGVSLGGYYVVRSAAFEPRLKAVAGVSGPYDMAARWDTMPSLTRETFTHHSGASDQDEGRERAAELSLAGVAERVTQPCLVITGKLDRIVPPEQTKRIADEVANGEWVLYDEGTHVCNNIPFKYRPLVADWMRDQLG